MATLILAEGLSKSLPDGDGHALADVDLRIEEGAFVAVVGASGSGKTTLLSLLGLLAEPSAGRLSLMSHRSAELTGKQRNQLRGTRIGFVFQNSYVLGERTVFENIALPCQVQGMTTEETRDRVLASARQVGLIERSDDRAGSLSGGEKQRVALARALVTRPDLLLADEPTGALDAHNTTRLLDLIHEINGAGTTVVVATHDPEVAARAHRRISLLDGRIVADDGTPPEDSVTREDHTPEFPKITPRLLTTLHHEFKEAISAVVTHPRHIIWVLLAYVLGIAALVSAIGLTASTTGAVVTQLTAAGSSEVRIQPPASLPPERFHGTAPEDGLMRLQQLTGVDVVAPVSLHSATANRIERLALPGGPRFTGTIVQTNASGIALRGGVAETGSLDVFDLPEVGCVAALGTETARELGVASAGVGVSLMLNSRPVSVAATLAPTGDVLADREILLSAECSALLAEPDQRHWLVATLPGFAEPVAQAAPVALAPENPGAFQVLAIAQLRELQAGVRDDLAQLLTVVGTVILVLSATTAGISLFLSVQHRAPQIALRRAVGASRFSIWRIFTMEGLLIGFLGGCFGVGVGVATTWVLCAAHDLPLHLGLGTVIGGLAISVVAGICAAAHPAWHAATRDPAAILRTL